MVTDTQDTRLEVQLEAWGPGMQHWVLDYIVLPGLPSDSPADPKSVWARLDEIRRTPLLHASGRAIMISADGIDAGGHHTQDVYNYGSDRVHLGCTVLGGSPRPNRPIISSAPSKVDIDWGGTKRPGGVERWMVGTDVAKDYLFNRFHLLDGPGAMHFHNQLPPEWFTGLVVEQPRTRYVKGRAVREWSPTRLLVGLPYNMDGTETVLTGACRGFARELERRYGLPVEFVDERLTSSAAQGDLREARRSGARTRRIRREDIDANAARLILETWMRARPT